ncbi:tetratricopeptide repeat protein [Sphingobium ummariense]
MLVLPAAAGASVDPDGALRTYARARLADGEGELGLAVSSYRQALAADPTSLDIARRSYFQALESGDKALALKAAALLDDEGLLPRDGTLLRIGDALERKDWTAAGAFTDRMVEEGNFAFLAPMVRSWITAGATGAYAPPVLDPKDRFAPLARRYADEQTALLALAKGDLDTARPAMERALALRISDAAALRLTFAGQLAARGAKAEALALLAGDDANYAVARADILRGRKNAAGAPFSPARGFAQLLARLGVDIATDDSGRAMGTRLARIATFADPLGAEPHIVAARLLTAGGLPVFGAEEARKVPAKSWHAPLAQAEMVDAMAEAGDKPGAIALAQSLAAVPGAEAERYVRLGRLLADARDFDGAAAAFRQAQARYQPDAVPWLLLLFEGSALEQGKRWEEARAVLQRALKLAPDEPVLLNYLGYAQVERRQNVEEALALLKRASALKPTDSSITDSLGWAQFVTGDVRAAVPVLERAAAGAPTDVTINEHLGDALWAAGRRYEARYAWRAAAVFAEGDAAERLAAKAREGMKPEYAAP